MRGARSLLALSLALAALGIWLGTSPAALAAGTGAISGVVTSSSEAKEPIAGIEVCVQEAVATSVAQCTTTKEKGEYEVAGLTEGNYDVKFSVPAESGLNYLTQFFNGKAIQTEAEPVSVVEGAVTPGIDAALLPGGMISGTVSSAATKAMLADVRVCARDAGAEVERCAMTAADGTYAITALASGGYVVHFEPFGAESSHAPQFYNDATSEAAAEAVIVTAGATATGIDAVLQGVPVALLKPAIAGRAIEGQTLTFLAGTWTNSPTSLIDEWGRCDATGAIETCHTIATTPTYTLTVEDVGHTIRIREQASNEYGVGAPQYLFSPPSAVVAAPAQAAAPGGAVPAPGPGSGVLSTAAKVTTTAQLKALLASLLAPRGKSAKIGALLKHRGYAVSFVSLTAGRLSIAWYLVPKGARVSGAKPVLAAVGKISTPASGASKLTVRLTAKGRSLLAPGKPLKLTAKGVLAASGRPSLVATRSFTLKR